MISQITRQVFYSMVLIIIVLSLSHHSLPLIFFSRMYFSETKGFFLIIFQVSVLPPAAMQHYAFKKTRMILPFISFMYGKLFSSRPAVGIIFLIFVNEPVFSPYHVVAPSII